MTHPLDPQHSVRHIRRRLFALLMQAFGAMVILAIVLLVGLVGIAVSIVSRDDARFRPSLAHVLEAYYMGRGGWAGVEAIVLPESGDTPRLGDGITWRETILLDETGRVLVDRGQTDTALAGQTYSPAGRQVLFPLTVNGTQVGTLVFQRSENYGVLNLFLGLLPIVAAISFFTGVLTLLIGFLLARRVVTPLADVIAAAHAVADGDLSTRVPVSGPGDLRGLSDSFNRMADSLERNDHERRDLLADVAHELRTPLTIIRGKLEGIVDGVYPADETHVAQVLEETYLLERLVEDLRLLTLAESGQLHFDLQPVDLSELARQTADLFAAEASEKNVAISVEAASDLPTVSADPQRLSQVIGNLVSNALRYAPTGGWVTITARGVVGGVELAVSDNGPGVPESDLPKLFDRFWRGEKSRSRAAGGAGLGLAIARQLVEAQGGSISASNVPGGGFQVTFILK